MHKSVLSKSRQVCNRSTKAAYGIGRGRDENRVDEIKHCTLGYLIGNFLDIVNRKMVPEFTDAPKSNLAQCLLIDVLLSIHDKCSYITETVGEPKDIDRGA